MKVWPRKRKAWSANFIQAVVHDEIWQRFRLSMKGLSTENKLEMLNAYVLIREAKDVYGDAEQCRVDNYINALLRGGQLKHEGDCIVVQR